MIIRRRTKARCLFKMGILIKMSQMSVSMSVSTRQMSVLSVSKIAKLTSRNPSGEPESPIFNVNVSNVSLKNIYPTRIGESSGNIYPLKNICGGYVFRKLTKLTSRPKNLVFDPVSGDFRCQFGLLKTDKCQFETDIRADSGQERYLEGLFLWRN